MEYYIQGSSSRAKEIRETFEAKGCTLYRLISQCDSEDLIYYSLNGRVRCIKKDNLYLFEAHPGYTKLELPVKSKFKVGDCVVNDYCAGKVIALTDDAYLLDSGQGIPFSCEHNAHLWSIEDAKDGDVLVKSWSEDGDSWEKIIIFKKYHTKGVKGLTNRPCVEGYGNTFKNGKLAFNEEVPYYSKTWTDNLQPANTKQRDLLFQKMKENGYEWDCENKELCKIIQPKFKVGDEIKTGNTIETIVEVDNATRSYCCESGRTIWFENQDMWHLAPKSHYDIANFHAGMPVLVREYDTCHWQWVQYSHFNGVGLFFAAGKTWRQCIPFEGNEHLLGTTNMPDEYYINW